MKLSTENSLKRFLKRKVKITLGFVVAFMITGTVGYAETLNITEATNKYEVNNRGAKAYHYMGFGVKYYDDIINKIEVKDKIKEASIIDDINIDLNDSYDTVVSGIHVESVISDNNSSNMDRIEYQEKLNLTGKNINLKLVNNNGTTTSGIKNGYGGILNIGGDDSIVNINVTNNAEESKQVIGIFTVGNSDRAVSSNQAGRGFIGGTTVINGKELNITVKAENCTTQNLIGIFVNNETLHSSSEEVDEELYNQMSTTIINSEKTKIDIENKNGTGAVGIMTYSNGKLEINGDLEVDVKVNDTEGARGTAITTRGNSITKINEDGTHTVKLNGDIFFVHDSKDMKNEQETDLLVNLSNSESYFTGKIESVLNKVDYNEEKGMKLGLSNGGTWNVTGDSFVNDLNLNNGVINIKEVENGDNSTNIEVDNLHGNGGTLTFETAVVGNEVKLTDGSINIKEVDSESTPSIKVGFSGINSDNLIGNNVNLNEAFGELKDKITSNSEIDETYFAKEGLLYGEITAKDNGNGGLTITQTKESSTVTGLKDLATINYLSWKQEMSSLTQRMGELRNSTADNGVWARVYGGKVENGSQYDNEYQTYQVGFDKKYNVDNGKIYLGYLVSYTDGETNYSLGNGENYSVGAGIYATWLNNNGHYVDVLYKVSRLTNKFDVNGKDGNLNSTGKYDTWGISLSGEYGRRFDVTDKWFVEPSVALVAGRLGEETYTTNSGIEVSQDSIYTAEGRIGTVIGYKFADKGNVYARMALVKEFAGDIDTKYNAGAELETSEDLGDTWLEFGIGVNYRVRENVNLYADLEKTGDATVDTKWQANLGFRYEF